MKEFDAVYGEYRELVRRFLLRLCCDDMLADELTQETFYRAMRAWGRFRGESSPATWLCAIARNLYRDTLKLPREAPLDEALETVRAPDVAEALVASDRMMKAQRLLHRLPEPYREVFTLCTFCELSHAQIGELFEKTESWARVTYFRARQMLQKAIREAEKDEG